MVSTCCRSPWDAHRVAPGTRRAYRLPIETCGTARRAPMCPPGKRTSPNRGYHGIYRFQLGYGGTSQGQHEVHVPFRPVDRKLPFRRTEVVRDGIRARAAARGVQGGINGLVARTGPRGQACRSRGRRLQWRYRGGDVWMAEVNHMPTANGSRVFSARGGYVRRLTRTGPATPVPFVAVR